MFNPQVVALLMSLHGHSVVNTISRRKSDDIDIDAEYALIQKKQSKLPAAKRRSVVRAYEARKKT